jgi:hypothetical protein
MSLSNNPADVNNGGAGAGYVLRVHFMHPRFLSLLGLPLPARKDNVVSLIF